MIKKLTSAVLACFIAVGIFMPMEVSASSQERQSNISIKSESKMNVNRVKVRSTIALEGSKALVETQEGKLAFLEDGKVKKEISASESMKNTITSIYKKYYGPIRRKYTELEFAQDGKNTYYKVDFKEEKITKVDLAEYKTKLNKIKTEISKLTGEDKDTISIDDCEELEGYIIYNRSGIYKDSKIIELEKEYNFMNDAIEKNGILYVLAYGNGAQDIIEIDGSNIRTYPADYSGLGFEISDDGKYIILNNDGDWYEYTYLFERKNGRYVKSNIKAMIPNCSLIYKFYIKGDSGFVVCEETIPGTDEVIYPSVYEINGGKAKKLNEDFELPSSINKISKQGNKYIIDCPNEVYFLEEKLPVNIGQISGVEINSTYNSNKVSWNAISGASGYEVYRATSKTGKYELRKTVTSGSTLSYTNTELITGKTYYYKVRAYKEINGEKVYGDFSTVVSATPKLSTTTAKAASASYSSNKVTWNKVSGASGYQIYRATSKDGKYSLNKTITSGSTLSYTNTGLTTGKTYYYKVKAYRTVDGNKVYGNYSSVVSSKPTLSSPTVTLSTGSKKAYVKWSKVSGASGYEVYRATSKSGTYSKMKTVSGGSTLSYTNTSLTSGKTYYYKVRAYKTVDGKKVYSSYSSVKYIKVK